MCAREREREWGKESEREIEREWGKESEREREIGGKRVREREWVRENVNWSFCRDPKNRAPISRTKTFLVKNHGNVRSDSVFSCH